MRVSEIIIVDDGSTDGSSELCNRIAAERSSDNCAITVIHQNNMGVSSARNAGLDVATGMFIFFVDSDDTVDSRKLAELMQEVGREDQIDMAVFGMSFDYYFGRKIYRQDVALPSVEGVKSNEECAAMLLELFQNNAVSSLCNKLIKKNVIKDSGIRLNEGMFLYEDLEFSLRVLARCKKIYFCDEPIYHYRQAQDEGNVGRRLKRVKHIPEIVDKIESALTPFGGNDEIVTALYYVLAKEKINCASRGETKIVCRDFRDWADAHRLAEKASENEFGRLLYEQRKIKLLIRKQKTKIRHTIAVRVKKTITHFR